MSSSSIPHPSYTFGGKSGTVVCTVAFQKVFPLSGGTSNPKLNGVNHDAETRDLLYICVDVSVSESEVC